MSSAPASHPFRRIRYHSLHNLFILRLSQRSSLNPQHRCRYADGIRLVVVIVRGCSCVSRLQVYRSVYVNRPHRAPPNTSSSSTYVSFSPSFISFTASLSVATTASSLHGVVSVPNKNLAPLSWIRTVRQGPLVESTDQTRAFAPSPP